ACGLCKGRTPFAKPQSVPPEMCRALEEREPNLSLVFFASYLPRWRSFQFHIRALPSLAPVMRSGDWAAKRTFMIAPVEARKAKASFFAATSQRRTIWSSPVEATTVPSGSKATDQTSCVWPSNLASWLPVLRSQRRTVWSQLPEARYGSFGEKATVKTV